MRRNWEEFGEVVLLIQDDHEKWNRRMHQQALLEYLEQRPYRFSRRNVLVFVGSVSTCGSIW